MKIIKVGEKLQMIRAKTHQYQQNIIKKFYIYIFFQQTFSLTPS